MKGFTLVEVLVTMGIAISVGALLLVIITNSAGMYYKQSSKLQEGLNINDSLGQIRSGIKQANAVAVSYIDQEGVTYTSNSTQLVLKIPSQDALGNIILFVFDYFIYFSDGSFLRFKSFPDAGSSRKVADQILSNSLNSLLFQYFDTAVPPNEVAPASSKKVKVTLTLKQKSGADLEINTATSEANLRND
ncbi:hypothetical protein A3C26_02240 [Candidatus Daviesbacteria bacterium RIFCSPHIGHO2_02_FULL_39_12]|uniref:Prepilin-type N-terminal cleavage/methylation domain-containing protein n=2 Tax=Candidatus Daviesiibacteriota TaxID=1752718 RepID=A0A1F5JA43_9BACT|nr:MAG: hypothetical protein A3C26_02240 [Candidatus Daviesbacteria bacterium RIFCSPHIGHO2_02_FULL_39_12]OGE71676.1 MAG: hypothetical protein A3H40_01550 [Candidatus Daviesbacteria bacterium RIFCSPLOWO2_02_FULL_38_15]